MLSLEAVYPILKLKCKNYHTCPQKLTEFALSRVFHVKHCVFRIYMYIHVIYVSVYTCKFTDTLVMPLRFLYVHVLVYIITGPWLGGLLYICFSFFFLKASVLCTCFFNVHYTLLYTWTCMRTMVMRTCRRTTVTRTCMRTTVTRTCMRTIVTHLAALSSCSTSSRCSTRPGMNMRGPRRDFSCRNDVATLSSCLALSSASLLPLFFSISRGPICFILASAAAL